MSKLRKAAEAALEALIESVGLVEAEYASNWRHGMPTRAAQLATELDSLNAHKQAIDALRAALAAPTAHDALLKQPTGSLEINHEWT